MEELNRTIFNRPKPIRAITQECRNQLEKCTETMDPGYRNWAENRLSDFNLWDAGVGASARTFSSLDKRLDSDKTAQTVVISSIDSLTGWLLKWKELADSSVSISKPLEQSGEIDNSKSTIVSTNHVSPSASPGFHDNKQSEKRELPRREEAVQKADDDITIEEARSSVEEMLHIIIRLGISIRRAGAASRLQYADQTFDGGSIETLEIIESYTRHLQVRNYISFTATRNNRPGEKHVGPMEIGVAAVHEKDTKLNEPLRPEQQILVESLARRAHRFALSKQRMGTLGGNLEQDKSKGESGLPSEVIPILESQRVEDNTTEVNQRIPTPIQVRHDGNRFQPALPAQSDRSASESVFLSEFPQGHALTVNTDMDLEGPPPTVIASRVNYPKPPKLADGIDAFICPYCCYSLQADFTGARKWRKHVSEDLMPYTCYLAGCPNNNCFFDSFKAWEGHVSSGHRYFNGWKCTICQTASNLFEEQALRKHLQESHKDVVAEDYVDRFLKASQVFDRPDLSKCPVCSINEVTWNAQKFQDADFDQGIVSFLKHIGKCMHDFALKILPSHEPEGTNNMMSNAITGISFLDSRSSLSSASLIIEKSTTHQKDGKLNLKSTRPPLNITESVTKWLRIVDHYNFIPTSRKTLYSLDGLPIDIAEGQAQQLRHSLSTVLLRPNLGRDPSNDEEWSLSDEEDDFQDIVSANMVQSAFERTPFSFLPEGVLKQIVTRNRLLKAMSIDEDEPLVGFILTHALKLFTITAFAVLKPQALHKAMRLFHENDFDDSRLPVETWSRSDFNENERNGTLHPFSVMEGSTRKNGKVWKFRSLWDFQEHQFKFLAPVFTIGEIQLDVGARVIPFTSKELSRAEGSFGVVHKYTIQEQHLIDPHRRNHKQILTVAVKEIKPYHGEGPDAAERRWLREARAQSALNKLDSRNHIVHLLTAFGRSVSDSKDYYLVFEWADGGNLLEFWTANPKPVLTAGLIREVIEQLHGLSSAIEAAHNGRIDGKLDAASYRHGDLKPSNILRFMDSSVVGILKIGDWGEVGTHEVVTTLRRNWTTAQFGTRRYEAPELVTGIISAFGRDEPHRSRLADIWAFGCIAFEFVVWALYGHHGLTRFYDDVNEAYYQLDVIRDVKKARIHDKVVRWMEHMGKEPACLVGVTALGDLLDCVQRGLLVVRLPNKLGSRLVEDRTTVTTHTLEQAEAIEGIIPKIRINQAETPMERSFDQLGPARLRADQLCDTLAMILDDVKADAYAGKWDSDAKREPPLYEHWLEPTLEPHRHM
ncbi:hypothetical protein FB567DRAFT_148733 [Paraphoma chrysanthemicola]|uniref:Protein kinase domain-containing protein n=1 Tax=Paraphoma chrysanthemicola TaxID=798071 RepID=A0A8K0VUG6_9PLEO|nr:hypothetical protein FB567DRAFT_148733 [Paraphoma chrysanthemicola]